MFICAIFIFLFQRHIYFSSCFSSCFCSHQKLNFNMTDTDFIARVYLHVDNKGHIGTAFSTSLYYAAPLFPPTEPQAAYAHGERGSTESSGYVDVPDYTTSHASSSGLVASHGLTAASFLAQTRMATWSYQIAKASATTNSP